MCYTIRVINRKTKEVAQEETRKSYRAADRLYCLALKNVNHLIYKLEFLSCHDTEQRINNQSALRPHDAGETQ